MQQEIVLMRFSLLTQSDFPIRSLIMFVTYGILFYHHLGSSIYGTIQHQVQGATRLLFTCVIIWHTIV